MSDDKIKKINLNKKLIFYFLKNNPHETRIEKKIFF